jgi:hypothetical protein
MERILQNSAAQNKIRSIQLYVDRSIEITGKKKSIDRMSIDRNYRSKVRSIEFSAETEFCRKQTEPN